VNAGARMLTVRIPLKFRRRGGRKALVTPGVMGVAPAVDITLVKAVARAFRWRRLLEGGRYATVKELAAAERVDASYVSRVLRLTLLAPDLIEAILQGTQPEHVTRPWLERAMPDAWYAQRQPAAG
jgi:hypothetical protein